MLTGKRPCREVQLHGKVASAIGLTDLQGWRLWLWRVGIRLLKGPRASRWLQRLSGMSRAEATNVLRRLHIPLNYGLRQLPGNPRTLLSLEAAWGSGAEAVVFCTVGCDPRGVEVVYAEITGRVSKGGAAIELAYPYHCNGQIGRRHLPTALCLEVQHASANEMPLSAARQD